MYCEAETSDLLSGLLWGLLKVGPQPHAWWTPEMKTTSFWLTDERPAPLHRETFNRAFVLLDTYDCVKLPVAHSVEWSDTKPTCQHSPWHLSCMEENVSSVGWLVAVGITGRLLGGKSYFFSQQLGLLALVHQIPPHTAVCWCVGLGTHVRCERLHRFWFQTCRRIHSLTSVTHQEGMWADEFSVLLHCGETWSMKWT